MRRYRTKKSLKKRGRVLESAMQALKVKLGRKADPREIINVRESSTPVNPTLDCNGIVERKDQ